MEATPFAASAEFYEVGKPEKPIALSEILADLTQLVGDRNPNFCECVNGRLVRQCGG